MSQDTQTASTEDSATSQTQDSAIPDQNTGEIQENVTPLTDDRTPQDSSSQPEDNETEKLRKATATLAFEQRKAKRENLRLQAEMEALKSNPAPSQQTQTQTTATEPGQNGSDAVNLDDAMYDPEKLRSYISGEIQKGVKAGIDDDRTQKEQQSADQKAKDKHNNFFDASDRLAVEDPEYGKLVDANADILMSNTLQSELKESDKGAQVHRHLLQNPELISQINSMDPRSAIREVAKIEASFSDNNSGQQPKPNITNAPPVIDQSNAGSGPVESSANASGMQSYYAQRMAEKKAAAGR